MSDCINQTYHIVVYNIDIRHEKWCQPVYLVCGQVLQKTKGRVLLILTNKVTHYPTKKKTQPQSQVCPSNSKTISILCCTFIILKAGLWIFFNFLIVEVI